MSDMFVRKSEIQISEIIFHSSDVSSLLLNERETERKVNMIKPNWQNNIRLFIHLLDDAITPALPSNKQTVWTDIFWMFKSLTTFYLEKTLNIIKFIICNAQLLLWMVSFKEYCRTGNFLTRSTLRIRSTFSPCLPILFLTWGSSFLW